jgi:gluconate 2-dehydrogenase gamma chain
MGRVSRRRFLVNTALGAGAALGTAEAAAAKTITGEVPWNPAAVDAPHAAAPGGYRFLAPEEARFIEAAVARLIPADDLGPGAKEAGVAVFIDRQLAGPYGQARRWYMHGPWAKGTKSQGYQLRLTPAQLYRVAIAAVNEQCRKRFQGKSFDALPASDQDGVLSDLEKGKIDLPVVNDSRFFDLLLQNTVEGFFADPLYGGNRGMAGWKLIGFPGAHYDYRPYVKKHNQRLDIAPVAILGRPAWRGGQ